MTAPRQGPAEYETPGPDVMLAVRMADWLDDRYIDPLVGLVLPGAGDLLFAAVGMYPIFVALRRGMPAVVVARMIRNVAVDLLFGAIPVVGDVFDWVFKAHRRNANLLLERHILGPSPWRVGARCWPPCSSWLWPFACRSRSSSWPSPVLDEVLVSRPERRTEADGSKEADREMKVAAVFPLASVQVETVVEGDGSDGRTDT
jgi:hypothetical protein